MMCHVNEVYRWYAQLAGHVAFVQIHRRKSGRIIVLDHLLWLEVVQSTIYLPGESLDVQCQLLSQAGISAWG